MNLPDNLPPLPPVPPGFDRWEYRGIGWETEEKLPTLRCEKDIQLAEARTALELIADSHDAPQNDEYAREALARIDGKGGERE